MWGEGLKEFRVTPLVQWRWGSGERYKRRDSGTCVGVGFNPSSALEEAGVTQIETNWLFALTFH